MKKTSFINKFRQRHPVLLNALLGLLALVAGGYAALLLIDIFTLHGQEVKVPDVRYINVEQAMAKLDSAGLHYEVDSIFTEDYSPGYVIDQSVAPGSMVKPRRTIYLTYNMFAPPQYVIPEDITDMPGADGMTLLRSRGFINIFTDTVPSDKQGLIVQVSVDGRQVAPGVTAKANARITLSIGDGSMDTQEYDPLTPAERDTLVQEQIKAGKYDPNEDKPKLPAQPAANAQQP